MQTTEHFLKFINFTDGLLLGLWCQSGHFPPLYRCHSLGCWTHCVGFIAILYTAVTRCFHCWRRLFLLFLKQFCQFLFCQIFCKKCQTENNSFQDKYCWNIYLLKLTKYTTKIICKSYLKIREHIHFENSCWCCQSS